MQWKQSTVKVTCTPPMHLNFPAFCTTCPIYILYCCSNCATIGHSMPHIQQTVSLWVKSILCQSVLYVTVLHVDLVAHNFLMCSGCELSLFDMNRLVDDEILDLIIRHG